MQTLVDFYILSWKTVKVDSSENIEEVLMYWDRIPVDPSHPSACAEQPGPASP